MPQTFPTSIVTLHVFLNPRLGETAQALHSVSKALSIDPEGSHSRWLTLAQLQSGQEALQSYQFGLNIMMKRLQDGAKEQGRIRETISQTFSSMAELYMTELCYDENAEENVERFTQLALQYDPEVLYIALSLPSR